MRKFLGFSANIKFLVAGMFFAAFGMTFWGLFFNLYLDAMAFDKAKIGTVLALSNLGTAVFAIPVGLLCARLNLKKVLIFGLLSSTLAFAAALFSGGSYWLSGFVFLASGFATFLRVAMGPFIMANATEEERTYVFSAIFVASFVGSIAGYILGGSIRSFLLSTSLSAVAGYRSVILLGLGLALCGVIPFLFFRSQGRESYAIESHAPASVVDFAFSWKAIGGMNWPFLTKAMLPSLFITCGAGVVVQFMNLYFKDVFHLPDVTIGYLMAGQGVATASAALVAPVLAEKIGRVPTVVLTELASIPFMVWMGATGHVEVAQVCFVIRGALMNMAGPVSNALMMEFSRREEQSFLNALMVLVQASMWSFSAWLYGHVLGGNYARSFYVAAALYLIAAILFFLFFSRMERRAALRAESSVLGIP